MEPSDESAEHNLKNTELRALWMVSVGLGQFGESLSEIVTTKSFLVSAYTFLVPRDQLLLNSTSPVSFFNLRHLISFSLCPQGFFLSDAVSYFVNILF